VLLNDVNISVEHKKIEDGSCTRKSRNQEQKEKAKQKAKSKKQKASNNER